MPALLIIGGHYDFWAGQPTGTRLIFEELEAFLREVQPAAQNGISQSCGTLGLFADRGQGASHGSLET